MELERKASRLLAEFKGDNYSFGIGRLCMAGTYAGELGKRILIVGNTKHLGKAFEDIENSINSEGLEICAGKVFRGSGANAPREDVYRIATYIFQYRPDCLIAVGGGSTIDAVKGANVLYSLGSHSLEIEDYFGTGKVSEVLERTGRNLIPMVAVQTNASSAAHLTKYSNITDPLTGQKKLIVDDAIVPSRAIFDYEITRTVPLDVSLDGAMDGISHCLEVYYGAKGKNFDKIREVALTGIELIIENAAGLRGYPQDMKLREMLGLGTDLGGYAIMLGGTNGGHLTSFSLVDVTSHGRACGIMNPYYTLLFAPAIREQMLSVGDILKRHGYVEKDLDGLADRQLAETVAGGLVSFAESIGFPTTLAELDDFSDAHIKRALEAAKDPQLKMKLENMPMPLSPDQVDEYMGSVLEAARTGDISSVKTLPDSGD